MRPTLKVLIADDSPTARQLIVHMINSTSDMRVVAEAHNGKQAVQMASELKPDIILMDIIMPGMDGLEAAGEIMKNNPTPIVMVTASLRSHETDVAFQAIRLGALSVLKKPVGINHPEYTVQSNALLSTVRAMAGVRVIRHRQYDPGVRIPEVHLPTQNGYKQPEIVAIASSTGGPAALSEIFKRLPSNFALPVVVVQHISPDFLNSLVEWLSSMSPLPIEIAVDGGQPQPGRIYFAPCDSHLRLTRHHRFELDKRTRLLYTPSGDVLLESVAESYGANAIGVVLTGMGNDGARGLRAMYNAGAYTFAQDEATSVVFGMPQEAIKMGAARSVLPIHALGGAIAEFNKSYTG